MGNDKWIFPRWAAVALTVRYARRAQPVFRLVLGAVPGEYADWMEEAISVAEQASRTGAPPDVDLRSLRCRIDAVIKELGGSDLPLDMRTLTLAQCANFAAQATRCALDVMESNDTATIGRAYIISAFACTFSAESGSGGLRRNLFDANARDDTFLRDAVAKGGWTDGTVVPEGFFGPVWPENPPGEREGSGA